MPLLGFIFITAVHLKKKETGFGNHIMKRNPGVFRH
jgi:hypothetical protein